MKKKVKMTCVLKSGVVVKETIKVDPKHKAAIAAINDMKTALEDSVGYKEPKWQIITFGHTTIAIPEIAAITIK